MPSSTTSDPPQVYWSLPNLIEPVQVMPDGYTRPEQLLPGDMKAKESDPSRMAVYVCLLDEKPHLHPSLIALHKHRYNIHKIPLPTDPTNDLPKSQIPNTINPLKENNGTKQDDNEDVTMEATFPILESSETTRKPEWFMWKFSEEEENRRKNYLPLA
ncbi:uncharacterized protein L201_003721 [Kwoniella dendrophila CBS 6074]|uniref:Uncharacterized protein n=1 Tax=Kwoniella dendrophila CBS 6074 TaxID=1295534 RepID=A0AAX4JVG9_9TREE